MTATGVIIPEIIKAMIATTTAISTKVKPPGFVPLRTGWWRFNFAPPSASP
jgi:hypothetical protein